MNTRAIERIREFNRFYTSIIGVLDHHILESPFSLSEARILFELNRAGDCTARQIMQTVNIDEGYLSRIIDGFIKRGIVKKAKSESDGRAYKLSLTSVGKSQFRKINHASAVAINEMILHIPEKELKDLLQMMEGIQHILSRSHANSNT